MKIAQVSLLHDGVAPWPSANAARSMLYLIEELVSEGHELTLFASEEWETSAQLVRLRHIEQRESGEQLRSRTIAAVARQADNFDVIHFHCDHLDFDLAVRTSVPAIATLHAPCAGPEGVRAADMALIPTSHRQQRSPAQHGWRAPIPQGLPLDLHRLRQAPREHLVFVGPIEPESGIESAVIAAARSKLPLKVVCEVPPQNRQYFLEIFMPLLRGSSQVQWVSEAGERLRDEMLGGAVAVIAPDDRYGAYELNVAEALACGTPVIAWSDTAAADIIEDGVSGYVVKDLEQAVSAVARAGKLNPQACRRAFEERFDVRLIARQYLDVYRGVIHAYNSAAVTVGSCVRGERYPPAPGASQRDARNS